MSNNKYTVVIPAYNAEKFIAECLHSVLSQTIPPQQIIVVDDGSVDATAQIARSASSIVKVISTPNRGAGSATTKGVADVQTDIVAFVDSDDLWHPRKMEIQLARLNDTSQHCDAVIAKMRSFGDTHIKNVNEEKSHWHRSNLALWMKSYHKVGDIRDLGNGYGEMIDWFSRAKHIGLKFAILDDVLADRRIHSGSVSFNATAGQAKDFITAARLAFQRKNKLL